MQGCPSDSDRSGTDGASAMYYLASTMACRNNGPKMRGSRWGQATVQALDDMTARCPRPWQPAPNLFENDILRGNRMYWADAFSTRRSVSVRRVQTGFAGRRRRRRSSPDHRVHGKQNDRPRQWSFAVKKDKRQCYDRATSLGPCRNSATMKTRVGIRPKGFRR